MPEQKRIVVWSDTIGKAKCRGENCGKTIIWGEIAASGKKMCFDGDAVVLKMGSIDGRSTSEFDFTDNHWATCPNAKRFDTGGPKHKCAIEYCGEQVPISFLMCTAHWRKVPANLQRDVWKTYKKGQEKIGISAASMEYLAAVDAACSFVARKERGLFS